MRAWRIAAALLASAAFVGCGREPAKGPPAPSVFTVHVPCVVSAPIQKVVAAYEETHPTVSVDTLTEKPLAALTAAKEDVTNPAVIITMGELEMDSLVAAGVVDQAQVVPVARNAYHLAVIVPASNDTVKTLSDLAKLEAGRLALEDPKVSTLGARGEEAFRKLGMWEQLEPRVVRFDPTKNVLSQLLEGKADAALVYRDCLFAEGGSPPSTVRLVGEFPADSYGPITYQAAPLRHAEASEETQKFVTWLTSEDGKKALRAAGLSQ
jgi:molybdate transport system substrate-binding protein